MKNELELKKNEILTSFSTLNVSRETLAECKKIQTLVNKKFKEIDAFRIAENKKNDQLYQEKLKVVKKEFDNFKRKIDIVEKQKQDEKLKDIIRLAKDYGIGVDEFPKSWYNITKKIEDIETELINIVKLREKTQTQTAEEEKEEKISVFTQTYTIEGSRDELIKFHALVLKSGLGFMKH